MIVDLFLQQIIIDFESVNDLGDLFVFGLDIAGLVAQLFDFTFEGVYNPSFFYGTSGIGYSLLRLGVKDIALPCILLLQ